MDAFRNVAGGSVGPQSVSFTGLGSPQSLGQPTVALALADSFSRQANIPENAPVTDNEDQRPISTQKKVGLFLKGFISPLTDPFSSTKSFLIATGVFIAHAALLGATGGAAAVPLIVLAAAAGVYHTGKALIGLKKAKTNAEEEKAIKNLGAGIGNLALMGIGAKPALKEGTTLPSETIHKMSIPKAIKGNVKQTPQALRDSKDALLSGNVTENTKVYLSRQVTETRDKLRTTHAQIKTQWANKEVSWQDRAKGILSDLARSLSITSLLGMS